MQAVVVRRETEKTTSLERPARIDEQKKEKKKEANKTPGCHEADKTKELNERHEQSQKKERNEKTVPNVASKTTPEATSRETHRVVLYAARASW